MKNDLTSFEKDLLRIVNLNNRTNYNYKHFMEWSTSKDHIESNLEEGELIYEAFSVWVAINPTKK